MSFHLQDQDTGSGFAIELAFSQAVSAPLVATISMDVREASTFSAARSKAPCPTGVNEEQREVCQSSTRYADVFLTCDKRDRNDSLVVRRSSPKIGRNEPCSCGSGRKFKICCDRVPVDEYGRPRSWPDGRNHLDIGRD